MSTLSFSSSILTFSASYLALFASLIGLLLITLTSIAVASIIITIIVITSYYYLSFTTTNCNLFVRFFASLNRVCYNRYTENHCHENLVLFLHCLRDRILQTALYQRLNTQQTKCNVLLSYRD